MTERQTKTLNIFLDGYEAKITSKNWANLNNCSTDTANRDIQDLVTKGVLREDLPGAKRPSYSIIFAGNVNDITLLLTDVNIVEQDGLFYITGNYQDLPIKERILKLDAERYLKGDLPLKHLIDKYLTFILNTNRSS